MAKKAKKSNHSKKSIGFPKLPRYFHESIHKGTRPLPEKFALQYAEDFWNYYSSPDRFEQKNGLTLEEFDALYGITSPVVRELAERYECISEVRDRVRYLIGMRRENGMMHKDLDLQATSHCMRHYSDMWRGEQDRRDELKKELSKNDDAKKSTSILVVKECFNKNHEKCCKNTTEEDEAV